MMKGITTLHWQKGHVKKIEWDCTQKVIKCYRDKASSRVVTCFICFGQCKKEKGD